LDKDLFRRCALYFVQKHIEEEGDSADRIVLDAAKASLDLLVSQCVDAVFSIAESPIEKIFINSLVLNFAKNGTFIMVTPRFRDTKCQISEFRQYHHTFTKFVAWYKERHRGLAGIESYLDDQVARRKMEREERETIWRHVLLYEYLPLYERFHLSLQAGFPDLRVDGKAIRTDVFLWIPSRKDVNVVVECDGFQYHSDKASFIRDRKRDRIFRRNGCQVFRYSGPEIHRDPIAASSELYDYLCPLLEEGDEQTA
jgi:hypothetical protein